MAGHVYTFLHKAEHVYFFQSIGHVWILFKYGWARLLIFYIWLGMFTHFLHMAGHVYSFFTYGWARLIIHFLHMAGNV